MLLKKLRAISLVLLVMIYISPAKAGVFNPKTFTLKNGIENMLKNMMGDKVAQVIAING